MIIYQPLSLLYMNNKFPSPTDHLQRQELLLRMEYEFEKEEFKRQTETMGIARKVKRGLCWYPATPGRSYYNSLNQLVIEITHTEDTDIEHNFEFGRPVCFSAKDMMGRLLISIPSVPSAMPTKPAWLLRCPVQVLYWKCNLPKTSECSFILMKRPTALCSKPSPM